MLVTLVLVRVLQRNKINRIRICMCSERDRDREILKGLTHAVMEVDKSKVCRVSCQVIDPGKSYVEIQV